MIEVVIPLSIIPKEVLFGTIFGIIGLILIFISSNWLKSQHLFIIGILCVCASFMFLCIHVFWSVIYSMPPIPNIILSEFPISVKVT